MASFTPIARYHPRTISPYSRVQPFTYRDGRTFIEVLSELRQFIEEIVIPYIDDNVEALVDDFNEIVAAIIAELNETIDNVNSELSETLDNVNALQALYQQLYENVQTIAAQVVQDAADASGAADIATQAALDALEAAQILEGMFDENGKLHPDFLPEIPDDETVAGWISTEGDSSTKSALVAELRRRAHAVDIRDYGALPAPYDSTEAFIAAANERKAVYIPPGDWTVTDTIPVRRGTHLEGVPGLSRIMVGGIPEGRAAIHVFDETTQMTRTVLYGFDIVGDGARLCNGIRMGDSSINRGVTDFTFEQIRIADVDIGIVGRYSWSGIMDRVRTHNVNQPMVLGPQVNNVAFRACSYSTFRRPITLNNAEALEFSSPNIVNSDMDDEGLSAFSLAQSRVVLTNPYFEFVSVLARIGSTSQGAKSVLSIRGGRVTGRIDMMGSDNSVSVDDPWIVTQGIGDPNAKFQMGNADIGNRATRSLRIGAEAVEPGNVVLRWRGSEELWTIPDAYGGAGVTTVKNGDYHTATSTDTGAQGARLTSDLIVGKQYMLTYRIRKETGVVSIKHGEAASGAIPITTAGEFDTYYLPFIASGASLRLLWAGSADIQFIGLAEGLRQLV